MADVREILAFLESEGAIKTHRQTGNYMQVSCPFHSDGQEKKPSCGVLLTDEYRSGRKKPAGFWHCFSCHYAKSMPNAVKDLIRIKNLSDDAVQWLHDNVDPPDDEESMMPDGMLSQLAEKYAITYIDSMLGKKKAFVTEEELKSYRFTIPYMYERKMTDALIEKFDVGYDANFIPPGRKRAVPCITFPVRDRNGNTLFFCRRSIVGKMYNYPEGVEKPLYGIYELPDHPKSIMVCESCINVITAYRYGKCAVGLMGTGNEYQMHQLRSLGASEYVICTDGDDAGRKAARKLRYELRQTAIVWTIPMPDGKDLNDLTEDEFNALYKMRE